MLHIQPDALFLDDQFVADFGLTIDDDGIVQHIGSPHPSAESILRLEDQIIIPGFVNSHSHVFQRLLRGRVESANEGASFWSWRKHMYSLVDRLTPDLFEMVARYTYTEMVWAGYTQVKEFHYLHHAPNGQLYDDPHEMSVRLVQAAQDARIDLELLRVAYPITTDPTQQRFADPSIEESIARTDALKARVDIPVGIAPHSIRAVTPQGIGQCLQWAQNNHAECHAHVAEQPKEVAWAMEKFGYRPLETIAKHGPLSSSFTAVHATHLSPEEIRMAGQANITICFCPTTEANLGDGMPSTHELLKSGVRLAIGSDSQAEINPFVELRLLEYNERNRLGHRRVLEPRHLLKATTESIAVGHPARFLTLDRSHPTLAGSRFAELASAIVMAARPDCITGVWHGSEDIRQYPNCHRLEDLLQNLHS